MDPDVSEGVTADPIQTYQIAKVISHEEYKKSQNFENDIGLVKVTKDIVYSGKTSLSSQFVTSPYTTIFFYRMD